MSEPQFCGADHTGEPIFVGQLCRSVVNPVRFGEVLGTNFIGADFAVVELRGIGPDHGKSFRVEDVDLLPLDILDLIALESR